MRLYVPQDFENLLRFYAHFERADSSEGVPPTTHTEIQRWLHDLDQEGGVQFVAALADRVIGHAWLRAVAGKAGPELGVFVHHDFRGLRIGRGLLLGALSHGCREMRLRTVAARVPAANHSLRNLLGSIGFQSTASTETSEAEISMARRSGCDACRGSRCPVYNKTLPQFMRVSPAKSAGLRMQYGRYCDRALSGLPVRNHGRAAGPPH